MDESRVLRSSRGLETVSIADINREVARRRKGASQLEVKRAKLLGRVAELEREIREYGGSPNSQPVFATPRGGRSATLQEPLATLLNARTMTVTAMAKATRAFAQS